jgi:hypothetical protein
MATNDPAGVAGAADGVGKFGPLLRLAGDIGREVDLDGLLLAILARAPRSDDITVLVPRRPAE